MRRQQRSAALVIGVVVFAILACFEADAQTIFPFLNSPLRGYGPYTLPIVSVVDHSMTTPYSENQEVIAFTGEKGYRNPVSGCYTQQNDQSFSVNGNYTGTSSTGGLVRLCYDGHPGLDLLVGSGTPVYAAASGTVVATVNSCAQGDSQCGTGAGNYVKIDHGNGYQTLYFHLKTWSVAVSSGATVTSGQYLAESGATGNVSGAHLHFEVRRYVPVLGAWVPVDPFGWQGNGSDPYKKATSFSLWLGGYTIYDENFASGWEDWSWGCFTNFAYPASSDPTRVRIGSYSLRVKYSEDWGGLYLHNYGFYTGGKNALTFAVQFDGNFGIGAARNLAVQLLDAHDNELGTVGLLSYIRGGTISPDIWYQVVIPLTALGAQNTTITGILMMSPTGNPRVYIDDLKFR